MIDFKKNKYTIIRQAISQDLATFIANYFCMQKQVYDTCRERKYFSPFENIIGYYEEPDGQIPNTYSTLLTHMLESIKKVIYYIDTKIDLVVRYLQP